MSSNVSVDISALLTVSGTYRYSRSVWCAIENEQKCLSCLYTLFYCSVGIRKPDSKYWVSIRFR